MTDHHPGDRPGHLNIDAVSAFVDRDLEADELTTIEFHLHECPACHREVLEIRTTVVLLTGLPQYTPRRSFCLGHEHARASRRSLPRGRSWSGSSGSSGYPASAASAVANAEAGRAAGWLPGLQAAAMVVGVLLLLVTSSDLMGMPPQPKEWLSDEVRVQQLDFRAAPAPESAPPAAPAMEAPSDSNGALRPASSDTEPSFKVAANPSAGTTSGNSASEEMLEDAESANPEPSVATSAALAAPRPPLWGGAARPPRWGGAGGRGGGGGARSGEGGKKRAATGGGGGI